MDDIDYERLKNDIQSEIMGAFWGAGFGGALSEAAEIENATDEELLEVAREQGIDISQYVAR